MSYRQRLSRLQLALGNFECDALLVEDPIDLYYLTGLDLSVGKILITQRDAVLFVDKRYFELCQKQSPIPVWEAEKYALGQCLVTKEFSRISSLGFDCTKTSYKNYQLLSKQVKSKKTLRLIPLDSPLQLLRAVKDSSEIKLLKEAAALGSLGYDFVLSILKTGITEIEVANQLEIFWKQHGSKGLAFNPIIAFGPNSSMPHYRAGNKKLKKGDIVLIDIGVNLHHYHSDMTRTIFFGKANSKLLVVHAIVKEAQQAALSLCKPGSTVGELDVAARQIIADNGYGPQFTHSLGHGVGLEIHEFPVVKNSPPYNSVVLEPGMVITIEPGIYIPELGGVRIEDTVAITKKSYVNLTLRDV